MHLETIQPSVVQTYLCKNVADEFSKLKIDVRSKKIEGHVLAQSQFIDTLLDILSQAALDIWPHWYNNDQLLHSVKKRHTPESVKLMQ